MASECENMCRICMSTESPEELNYYCACRGSVGMMHHACLVRWLQERQAQSCEICNENFTMGKGVRPLKQWKLVKPEKREILSWSICAFLIVSLTTVGIILTPQARESHRVYFFWIMIVLLDLMQIGHFSNIVIDYCRASLRLNTYIKVEPKLEPNNKNKQLAIPSYQRLHKYDDCPV